MTTVLFFLGGLIFLLLGAQFLVNSSSKLALKFGISPIVVGVTVVAFATSAPEIAVSLGAIINKQSGLALGNILGSNIANILLILGLSAVIAPIKIKRRIIRLDVPIMIAVTIIVFLLALDGTLQPIDGGALLIIFAGFLVFQVLQSKKESPSDIEETDKSHSSIIQTLWFFGGLGLLVLGAHWLVESAIQIAQFWGLSDLIIGLTIVAIGTSLPELATSIFAAWNNEADLSVGNVIGSNIFNILLVLGIAAFFSPGGITVSNAALALDFPLVIAVSIACLPIFFTGHSIARWEGGVFLGYYVAYLLYLFLDTTQHELLPLFNQVMILFVVPITVITLIVFVYRYWKKSTGD